MDLYSQQPLGFAIFGGEEYTDTDTDGGKQTRNLRCAAKMINNIKINNGYHMVITE
ncbi:hypothetical protein DPMN_003354 [Dreissena polymorpha]|uniref:Uncharacterized protein n=1 Tax=Dreissena polymorpha TaxID=45954 RepID=A0A9D4RS17_DREPO|nr:hypothetical protein DPMN_003354 [Dreissena polymorpha]